MTHHLSPDDAKINNSCERPLLKWTLHMNLNPEAHARSSNRHWMSHGKAEPFHKIAKLKLRMELTTDNKSTRDIVFQQKLQSETSEWRLKECNGGLEAV